MKLAILELPDDIDDDFRARAVKDSQDRGESPIIRAGAAMWNEEDRERFMLARLEWYRGAEMGGFYVGCGQDFSEEQSRGIEMAFALDVTVGRREVL